ncbi:peptidoglycan DD-metalloendopeptidase family protein [Thiocystis violacea]|uniref:peptidoglycan DD-metalloendopeptidase family protein n=1 Tax=Thiocystis violacea TaxID=13725 RepID=UPI001F5C0574|nr:peptidoglycan DD-metalloendopeptidase family protein [Thiocystis violacea]
MAIVFGSLILPGCSTTHPAPIYGWNWTGPAPEGYYLVQNGDSLSLVAERHGVSMRKLARWNRLQPPYTIYADTLLRVVPPDGKYPRPARGQVAAQAAKPAVRTTAPKTASKTAAPKAASPRSDEGPSSRRGPSGLAWEWPLRGALLQGFRAGDRTHQGIRIAGSAGEQVRAAADGVVVYSGSGLKGYGNLIIVKHNNKYLSAYGFNRRLLASEGDRVEAGQSIAEVGQGADAIYLLHFEVRRDGTAVDPILYLPARNEFRADRSTEGDVDAIRQRTRGK